MGEFGLDLSVLNKPSFVTSFDEHEGFNSELSVRYRMGQFVAGVKDKVNGGQGQNDVHEETPGALTVPQESRALAVAAHSGPPTDGHPRTDRGIPGGPGIMEAIADVVRKTNVIETIADFVLHKL